MSKLPEILWAQRASKIYLTVALPDAKDVSVTFEPEGLFKFSATGRNGDAYACKLELYGAIVPERCRTKPGLRNILCSIQKEQKGWWTRLLKSVEKPAPFLKVDWNKWRDEDDEDSESDCTSDDGAASENDGESNDDDGLLYLPDLEKARGK
ncbi:hypothetical protein RND81_06G197000 [Saponaria officinalis]|uniref:Co-chaperone protein p23 n=1 Tax=Saponaria officinalis TaxID=3572 RepID=A0AAW1KES8_SAPOF